MQANISLETRAKIVCLHRNGRNISQISKEIGISRNTVSRWVKRFDEEYTLKSRERSGRPPLINDFQRRIMADEYKTNGFIPTKRFAEEYDTSMRTVRRALQAQGFHHRKPVKKPFLSQRLKEERLRFAREYLHFNWETTVFSSEKAFRSHQNRNLSLWSKDNKCWTDINILNMESAGMTVNMWGWISAQGPGELEFIPMLANSSDYVDVLNDIMLPSVRNIYPLEDMNEFNFVQGNCQKLYTFTVSKWFHQRSDIKVIPWPAQSPDLNPIEDIWDLIVQKWEAREQKTPEQFKLHCIEFWDSLRGTDVCENIVRSMPKRLQSCINNNGGHIQNINLKSK